MRLSLSIALALLPYANAALPSCPDLSQGSPSVFDFVIVGSGAGGGPLAARLAENNYSVLLVDAGKDVDTFNTTLPAYWPRAVEDPNTELAYNVTEFSDPNSRVAWYPRAGGLGGSTIHNAMINIIAGTTPDFDGIANAFNDQSWLRSKMQEYFIKIEDNMYPLVTWLTLSEADHGFKGWLKTTLLPYANLFHKLAIIDTQLLAIFTSLTAFTGNLPILDLNALASDGSVGINTPSFTIDSDHVRSSVYNRLTDVHTSHTNNLNLALNTLATKMLLCAGSDGQPTAYGVEIAPGAVLPVAGNFAGKQNLQVQQVFARHEVIVSAGVFQSPQLLMLSGIGDSSQLEKFGIETVVDLPGVGSNLQDHDEIAIAWKMDNNFKLLGGCQFLSDPAQDPCLADWIQSDHQNVYAFSPVTHAIVTKSDESLELPDTLTYIAPAYFEGIVRGEFKSRSNATASGELTSSNPQKFVDNQNGFSAVVLLAHPSSRGYVRLTGSHPQDPLDIAKRHFEAPNGHGARDIQALVTGLERMQAIVEDTAINDFVQERAFPPSGANLTQHVIDHVFGHHACCTNPIGLSDDPNAVLDSDFRVYETNGLRVVDLSSWPNVPGYFVTTPTYMISEKAADSIMNDAKARNA